MVEGTPEPQLHPGHSRTKIDSIFFHVPSGNDDDCPALEYDDCPDLVDDDDPSTLPLLALLTSQTLSMDGTTIIEGESGIHKICAIVNQVPVGRLVVDVLVADDGNRVRTINLANNNVTDSIRRTGFDPDRASMTAYEKSWTQMPDYPACWIAHKKEHGLPAVERPPIPLSLQFPVWIDPVVGGFQRIGSATANSMLAHRIFIMVDGNHRIASLHAFAAGELVYSHNRALPVVISNIRLINAIVSGVPQGEISQAVEDVSDLPDLIN